MVARAPLCSQGQDSSGVQPTPVKPPPPRSWTGAHSAFQMCTHLPAGRCTQPHRCAPASMDIVWCCLGAGDAAGQTRRSSAQHCPRARFLPSWATGSDHLWSQEPLWVSFTNCPGWREAGPWNPLTLSPEACDVQLSPEAGMATRCTWAEGVDPSSAQRRSCSLHACQHLWSL